MIAAVGYVVRRGGREEDAERGALAEVGEAGAPVAEREGEGRDAAPVG
jgi:hypothetical protein